MLQNRIIGAFMFRKGVYNEAAGDTTFTQTAWLIVVVIQILNQLGTKASMLANGNFFVWLVSGLVGAALGVGAFALTTFLIPIIARELFRANTTFEQMVRALGLAHVWNVVGLIGIFGAVPILACLLGPIGLLAALAGLAAYLIAIKETTGMDWAGTIVVVIAAAVIQMLAGLVASGFLAIFGVSALLLAQ
jgi:hypothetical protein